MTNDERRKSSVEIDRGGCTIGKSNSPRLRVPVSPRRSPVILTFFCIFCIVFQTHASPPRQTEYGCKILVDESGIYTITPRILKEAGADLEVIDPKDFGMMSKGRGVSIYVSGDSDGRFDDGDYVEFYGQKHSQGEYTDTNVYWLSWVGNSGPRMVEEDVSLLETRRGRYEVPEQGVRQKVRFEVDNGRFQRYTPGGNTVWFWMRLNAPGLSQIPFELRNVSDSPENGSVRVMLHGSVNKKHNMEVFLNAGFRLGNISWFDQGKYLLENNEVPNYIFNEDKNAIGIYYSPDETQSKAEQVLLDWIEVEYWQDCKAYEDYLEFSNPQNQGYGLYQFEIEGFSNADIELFKLSSHGEVQGISKLTGGYIESKAGRYNLIFQDNIVQPTRYIALTSEQVKLPVVETYLPMDDLHSVNNGADYIIITHPDFYDSALTLAEFRADQGMRTAVVDVEDIYDEFSYGVFDPTAIRDLIRYAFHNWQKPPPQYVLLLGDASWWYKRDESYMPSYTYNSKVGDPGSEWGPTASDDYFVCVNGDDPLPDLAIGRIPAKTDEEARIAVEKVIEYERSPEPGKWRRSLLFLSGRQPKAPQLIFEEKGEEFIEKYISSDYNISRIYTDPDSPYSGNTSDLLNAIDEGHSFVRFAGHGGGSVWSDDDLLTLEDIPLLKNGGKLPFIVSWTCFTAWFDNPYTNCLAEDLLFLKGGGAVALFGSTGLGLLYADLYLEEEMYNVLFKKNERVVGQAIVEAKASFLTRFAGHRDYVDLAATYTLIGDPATRLILSAPNIHTRLLPDLMIAAPDISLRRTQDLRQEEKTPGLESGGLSPVGSASYTVWVPVHNIGVIDAHDVMIRLYNGNPFRAASSEAGSHRIAAVPSGGTTTVGLRWMTEAESAADQSSLYIWIDPSDEISEEDEANNIAQLDLRHNVSVVTPETGSDGSVASFDGIFLCRIPAGVVMSQAYLTIAPVDIPQRRDTQPDVTYAPLPGKDGGAYEIQLSSNLGETHISSPFEETHISASFEETPIFSPFEKGGWGDLKEVQALDGSIAISLKYDPAILTEGEREKLAIYRRLEAIGRWIICDGCVVGESIVSTEVPQPGIYALMINNDVIAPEINLTLKDQGFIDEDYVSSNPQVSIVAEDANGIKDVQVFLDGTSVSIEELSVSGAIGLTPFPVEYHPTLQRGTHIVKVEAHDLNGLSAASSLTLTVEPEFRIEDIANRPNPCRTRTLFTYVLTQPADDMTIKLYSSSGRLIKKLDAPTSAGYNELLWDLRDEDDKSIANGVYFYKLTAKREGERTEKIGKLAVLK